MVIKEFMFVYWIVSKVESFCIVVVWNVYEVFVGFGW